MDRVNDRLLEWGAIYGTKIIGALVILIVGYLLTKFLTAAVRRITTRAQVDAALVKFLATVTKVMLLVFVILAAMNSLGVQTTSFIALIGAAGLAVGLALQGSLANFAAGVMLILFRPFKGGDYVETAGVAGTVEEIHIFHTVLRTPDNKKVTVPNSAVTGGNIINYSAKEQRHKMMRVQIPQAEAEAV